MTPRQEQALLKAVVHLLEDYDDRLDSIALAMTDGDAVEDATELVEFREHLEELRQVLLDESWHS